MRHPKIIIAGIAVAAGGGTTAASASGSPSASVSPLYTFADDQPGQVTGQGVQDFFVATPGLAPITGSQAPAGQAPAAPSASGFGY